VLKLLAEGHTTQEIANMLVLSPKTVEGNKTNLMAKLGIHNRIELVKYALRKGVIIT
jgi:DNA-binding NarL/FixJ family response regulator